MIRNFIVIICLLQGSITFSQENVLSPQEAIQIINSGEYEIGKSVEYDLDTIGIQVIKQLFYDKANYPDRVSKEKYLDQYNHLSSFEKRNISSIYKILKNPEYRKRVYTLKDEDSVLVYGSKDIRYINSRKGFKDLWNIYPIDTTIIASNSYYSFFKFEIKLANNFTPRFIANGIISRGSRSSPTEYSSKLKAIIYNSRFIVGIPKVNLKNKEIEKLELPLLFLGEDFISYPINNQLLTSILEASGQSDSTSFSSLVHLYVRSRYGASSTQEFYEIPCQKLNLFKSERCYKFSVLEGSWSPEDYRHNYRSTDYIATLDKSYGIKYKLVEEPENLTMYIQESLNRYYGIYSSNSAYYKEPSFVTKRGKRFIYKTDYWIETERWSHAENGKEQFEYKKFKVKIAYKGGKVSFKQIKLRELH